MKQIERAGVAAVGEQDEAIAWVVLGAARLHYVLTQDEITSKSGTGGYVIEHLDPQWTQVAREALRISRDSGATGLYTSQERRGQNVRPAYLARTGRHKPGLTAKAVASSPGQLEGQASWTTDSLATRI